METLGFGDLVAQFHAPAWLGKPLPHFRVDPSTGFFVEPRVVEKEVSGAGVRLISARGAAGKSRSAAELSHRLSVPLWRLDLDRAVSGTALEFALANYLGQYDVANVIETLNRPLIVIDSLDEARTRVSGVSWNEFLESLSALAKRGLQMVLFGRERSLEDVWSTLEDDGTSVDWYEISHFGHHEARNYVDQVARHRDESIDPGLPPYVAARDAVIEALGRSLPEGDREAFVGYPPVLDAVAALLIKKANFPAIENAFTDNSRSNSLIAVLERILNDLLARESGKIAPLLEELDLSNLGAYDADEQIDWLLFELEDGQRPELPKIAEPRLRSDYVNRLKSFLGEHPFRNEKQWASPVFEAYVASRRFNDGFPRERLVEVGYHSGLLAELVAQAHSEGVFDEWQFAAIHGSVGAGQAANSTASVELLGDSAESELLQGSISTLRGHQSRSFDFTVLTNTPGEFRLLGPLSALSVVYPGRVVVPGGKTHPILGPDLFISCDEFVVEAAGMEVARVEKASDSPAVIVEAHRVLRMPTEVATLPRTEDLELRVPRELSLSYPWHSYRQLLETEVEPNDRAVRFLKMLMSLTRSHGHEGERCVFDKKLEGRQSLKRDSFKNALGVLRSRGVVRVEGSMIFVRDEWEPYRFSGKTAPGQRSVEDVMETWRPILDAIADVIK